jgi:hypothetical protein
LPYLLSFIVAGEQRLHNLFYTRERDRSAVRSLNYSVGRGDHALSRT